MKRVDFSPQQVQEIITLYQDQESLKSIGERYGVSRQVIHRVLTDNNIQLRRMTNRYKADYRKFQTIDSSEKAYWLGFLAADGCVHIKKNNQSAMIRLSIHQKDSEHLKKFKYFMDTSANIKYFLNDSGYSKNNPSPMCSLTLNSIDLAKDLIACGITPKKSFTLKHPLIPQEFFLPYILGYFDGDGSIFCLNGSNIYGINFEGTFETVAWINETLQINSKISKRYPDNPKNNYYIRCGGTKKPYLILKQLYDSCDIHLDRKYNKFRELEKVVLTRNC